MDIKCINSKSCLALYFFFTSFTTLRVEGLVLSTGEICYSWLGSEPPHLSLCIIYIFCCFFFLFSFVAFVARAHSCAENIKPSVSFLMDSFWSHFQVLLLFTFFSISFRYWPCRNISFQLLICYCIAIVTVVLCVPFFLSHSTCFPHRQLLTSFHWWLLCNHLDL